MSFFRRGLVYSFLFIVLLSLPTNVLAGQKDGVKKSVLIEVFERQECAHCQAEKAYLEQLQKERDDIEVRFIDITTDTGKTLFKQFTETQNIARATPITVIGTSFLQGFDTEVTTGSQITSLIETEKNTELSGGVAVLISEKADVALEKSGAVCDGEICAVSREEPFFVTLPFTNKVVDVTQYSLPVLSSILGFIDGFNPCAMWVLVTFLLVLIQMGSYRRMWIVAGLFIFAEALMYYFILNVWFTTWDFVGLDHIITPIVGVVSLLGGCFFLYEWYTSDGTCKIVNLQGRAKISGRIKKLASEPFTLLTVFGVIALAFSVNIIEFACSIGIPQAFTKIIQMNNLDFFQTQGYMALYILFYMLDDLLVFGLALWGFEKIHLTQKYTRYSNMIGGLLMILIGFLLIFYPSSLRFL